MLDSGDEEVEETVSVEGAHGEEAVQYKESYHRDMHRAGENGGSIWLILGT